LPSSARRSPRRARDNRFAWPNCWTKRVLGPAT